jgi:hypothetical protein
MRFLSKLSGLGLDEAIATDYASGHSTLAAVNRPMQLGSAVPSLATATPAERRLISLAQVDLAANLFDSKASGLPYLWRKADCLTFGGADSIG